MNGTEKMNRGHVALVGAGPGDPELLTVRALRLLKSADAVVYDRLVNERILKHCSKSCHRIYAGKSAGCQSMMQPEINRTLVRLALEGLRVVRLKGGDPFVFGRGGEEAQVLARAGIPFEIIPGVSSAIAVPAYAGIPITHRGLAGLVTFVTGHLDPESSTPEVDYSSLARTKGTLVFLMGARCVGRIACALMKNGMAQDTPVAIVENGTTPRQRTLRCRLAEAAGLAECEEVASPSVIVVGAVAALADDLAWYLPAQTSDGVWKHPAQRDSGETDGVDSIVSQFENRKCADVR